MMLVKRLLLMIALPLFAIPVALLAQEEEEGHVYTISTFKVRFDQEEEFLDLWEKEFHSLTIQNDFVLSSKILTHLWGPDWTVVWIREYEKFEDIAAAQKRGKELREEKWPSENQRDRIWKKIQGYILGHMDAIVQENPKLTK